MSNDLLKIAYATGEMRPSERAVLASYADRANERGLAWPGLGDTAERTRLNERSVRRALTALVAAGHLTRQPRTGRSDVYLVHPRVDTMSSQSGHGVQSEWTCESTLSGPDVQSEWTPCPVRVDTVSTKPKLTLKNPHELPARAIENAVDEGSDDAQQPFVDAWNGMAAQSGLPRVDRLTPARRSALIARVAQHGSERVLEAIASVGRSDWLTGRKRRPGQGDFRGEFGFVLGEEVFQKLIEGVYGGRPVPRPRATTTVRAPDPPPREEPADIALLRTQIQERIGDRNARSYLDPLDLVRDGDTLRVTAPSSFLAEWVRRSYASEMEQATRAAWGARAMCKISYSPAKQVNFHHRVTEMEQNA